MKLCAEVLVQYCFLSMFLLRLFGSKQSLRLPFAFLTGTTELLHSVCSWTGVMIPLLWSHCSSFLYAALILTGTNLGGVRPVHSFSLACCGFFPWEYPYSTGNITIFFQYILISWWVICVSSHSWVPQHLTAGTSDVSDLGPSYLLPLVLMSLSKLPSGVHASLAVVST